MAGHDDKRGGRDELSQTGRVKIIGATEAGKAAGAQADDAQPADRDPSSAGERHPDETSATEDPGGQAAASGEEHAAVELPHWTEPATGEVPSVLMRGADDDDPTGIWPGSAGLSSTRPSSTRTTPVWKGEHTQWAEESVDYEHSQLADEGLRIGAMELGPEGYEEEDAYGLGDYSSGGYEDDYASGGYSSEGYDSDGYGSETGGGGVSGEVGGYEPADAEGGSEAGGQPGGWAPTADASAGGVSSAVAGGEPYRHVRIRGASRTSRRTAAAVAGSTREAGALPGDGRGAGAGATGGTEAMGRNMWVAFGTGLLFGAVVLLMFKEGPVSSLALCVVLVTVSAAELFSALRRAGHAPATLLGLAGTIFVMIAAYLKGEAGIVLALVLVVVFTMLWYLTGVVRQRPVANIAVTLLGFAWVGILGSFGGLLLDPTAFPHRHGVAFLLGAGLATVAHDIGGLMVGRAFGAKAHPLARRVSPNKTWEGLAGGTVLALVVCMVIVRLMSPWSASSAFGLALIVVVMAPLGDLCESMIKRDLGVKDMGALLPGHGGMFDRVDAVLFVLPAVYYMVTLAHIG